MDQVRLILDYVRRYHFWLLCVAAVIAGLMGWMRARGTLSEEYKKGKSAVMGKFDALRQIQQEEFPPNVNWKEGIDKLTDEERQKVKTAWQTVYDEQQKVLEWPPVMGPTFKDVVMDWVKKGDVRAEFDGTLRGSYRNLVANMEFPKLPAIVEAKPSVDEKDGAGNPPPAADADDAIYKVIWDDQSQQKVKKALEMPPLGVPSSFAVWLKQEDLWVFRALLNIIRAANEGSQYTSRVKRISELSIGQDAAKEFQNGMKSGKIDGARQSSGEQGQAGAVDRAKPSLDEGRYVDENGNPLTGGIAQTAQFKRMPIFLRLVMDQREIPRLLSECANSPLPVEVSQLRINPEAAAGAAGGRAPARGGVPQGGASPTAGDPFDVTLEISGIIYIYNPPDANKLGKGGAATAVGGG
jgi:hypothetical protein